MTRLSTFAVRLYVLLQICTIYGSSSPAPTTGCRGIFTQHFCDNWCMPGTWVCDGQTDCLDGSDELNCDDERICSSGEFQCPSNGICIPNNFRCDGDNDCSAGEDELNCNISTSTSHPSMSMTPSNCSSQQFTCRESMTCIPLSRRCDGDKDCIAGEDEVNCPSTTLASSMVGTGCSEAEYRCQFDGSCIPLRWLCDSEFDCPLGDDEVCVTSTTLRPSTTTRPSTTASRPSTTASRPSTTISNTKSATTVQTTSYVSEPTEVISTPMAATSKSTTGKPSLKDTNELLREQTSYLKKIADFVQLMKPLVDAAMNASSYYDRKYDYSTPSYLSNHNHNYTSYAGGDYSYYSGRYGYYDRENHL